MGNIIEGPWCERLESSDGVALEVIHGSWAEYFEDVAAGRLTLSAEIAPPLARYFQDRAMYYAEVGDEEDR